MDLRLVNCLSMPQVSQGSECECFGEGSCCQATGKAWKYSDNMQEFFYKENLRTNQRDKHAGFIPFVASPNEFWEL